MQLRDLGNELRLGPLKLQESNIENDIKYREYSWA